MTRIEWAGLPALVRAEIEARTGHVTGSRIAAGDRSDITATLETESGPVFVKGAREGVFARSLRNEAATSPHVTGIAPRLRWMADAGGWTVLGFEHIDGRHADYAPGSPDLPLLKAAVEQLQRVALPGHVSKGLERHYGGLDVLAGDALLHTDLHSDNVLIANGRAWIVDWAWASKGAPWAEPAMLAFQLMAAGHTVTSAEEWGRSFAVWEDGKALDTFVSANARSWARAAERDPQDWKVRAADLAQNWDSKRQRL